MFVAFACITTIFPFLGLPLGLAGLAFDKKHWKWYVYCVSLFMANIAYSYRPTEETDLVRYLDYAVTMKNLGFSEAINRSFYREGGLYVFNFFCWLFALIGAPHLLPASSIFVVYAIFLTITTKASFRLKTSRKDLLFYLAFGFFSLNFYSLVNNVRNILAFSLVAFAFYRDLIEKKRNLWTSVLYIAPVFIHSTAIVFVAIRLLLFLPRAFKYFVAFIGLFTVPVLGFLYPRAVSWSEGNFVSTLIKRIVIKAYQYFYDSSSEWGKILSNSLSQKLSKFLYIVLVAVFVFMLVYGLISIARKKGWVTQKTRNGQRLFLEFAMFLLLITFLCFSTSMAMYWRFGIILVIAGAPLCFLFLKKKERTLLRAILLVCSLGFLFLGVRDLFRYSSAESILFDPLMRNLFFDVLGGLL